MEASTTRLAGGFVGAFALLALNAFVSFATLDNLVESNQLVSNAEHSIRLLGELRGALIDAETGQRGFLISGDDRYLEPYSNARPVITAKLSELTRLTSGDTERSARLASLEPLVAKRLDQLNEGILARRQGGAAANAAFSQEPKAKSVMDRIRYIIGELQNREDILLATRTAEADFNASVASVTFGVATFLNVCLLAGICLMVMRRVASQREAALAEHQFNAKLADSLGELQARNQEVVSLSQMSSFLQTCSTTEEACVAIARHGPRLFAQEAGSIFIFHASRNYLELATSWGGARPAQDMFQPADCWALRRGRLHAVGEQDAAIVCAHVAAGGERPQPYACAPMIAQGETLGLLYLRARASADGSVAPLSSAKEQLATAVAEQIALALSNLRLRETLRQQSVRDPLTGLYNRRFLEEALDREIVRVERKSLPLAVIMIDVDNFKNFNDTFGHEAGDAVLRDLGSVLQRYVRGSDIACRYGGEEFTIVLPEATLEIARQRAETLREAVRELRMVHDGKSLGAITLSLGVAGFPDHGRRREHLLQAADAALYEAKNAGRNQVVVSNVKTLKVVETLPQRGEAGH